jgi:methylenetetrahydrofolate dehydrogenase (NADP+)/methenyltetrahydrofolate cyclohydrolase
VAQILDGRAAAAALRKELAARIARLAERDCTPCLTMIRVGEDPASLVYVRAKERACRKLGVRSTTLALPPETSAAALRAEIARLNADPAVHGIILQLPVPETLPQEELIAAIDPGKDVDGFHPVNVGRLCLGQPGFVSATPLGILRLLRHHGVVVAGRRVVVLGRSRIVGRPLANLLSRQGADGDATVTICHSRTRDLAEISRAAEILIAAVGRPRFVTAEMVGAGAIVVDVGIHSLPGVGPGGKRRLCGDVAFDEVARRAAMISPVPGGVGPMTVACLVANTVAAAEAAPGVAPPGGGRA